MSEYEAVILGAFVLNWFFCFIPGFKQPADPSAVDAALTFHINVIKKDLTSQTCEKYKQLPADGLLQKDKALQELSHQNPMITPVRRWVKTPTSETLMRRFLMQKGR